MKQGEIDRAKRKALSIFDEWVEVTGQFEPGNSYRYEIEGIIEDAVEVGIKAALGINYSDVGKE